MITSNLHKRHNGHREAETSKMLSKIGVSSIEQLIDEIIPESIRLKKPINLVDGMNEYEYVNHKIHGLETTGVYTDEELNLIRSERLQLKDKLYEILISQN